MWYVYFAEDSWEQGVTVGSREEAEEIVSESNGQLACQYVQ